jgi:hypothetical protein
VNTTVRSLVALCCLAAAAPVAAQDSRTAVIAEEQAEKAKTLHPYVPNKAEGLITTATRGLIEMPSGFYPYFGSVYSGGGFTLGGGYRRFYGDRALWDAHGLFSIKSYKLLELTTTSPGHAGGHIDLYARTTWRDAPEVAFYGIGNDSLVENKTNFALTESSVAGGIRARTARWIVLRGELAYEDFNTTAPGPGPESTFVHTTATAGFDSRPSPGYARHGSFLGAEYHNYADRADAVSFERVDAEAIQHIPILRENWVLSFRGRVQTTLGDAVVPTFILPSLGSGSTLRAYSSWRFRDRHSELFSAEWRWIPNRLGLDMAIFYDAGKVTAERRELDFDGLTSNVGVGVRFHGPLATPLRIEITHGREGMHLVFSGGPAF